MFSTAENETISRGFLTVKVETALQKESFQFLKVWTKKPEKKQKAMTKTASSQSAARFAQVREDPPSFFVWLWMAFMRFARDHGFVVHPESSSRLSWEISGVFVLMLDLVWIPMMAFDPPESVGTAIIGWITLIYWTLDMLLTFNTGTYTKDGKLLMARSKIAGVYARGWLLLDFMIVAIDWLILLMAAVASSQQDLPIRRLLRDVIGPIFMDF